MPRWLKSLAAGLVPGLVGAVLVLTPLGTKFEQDLGLAWLFNARGALPAPDAVVVVAIDSDTGTNLGEVDLGSGAPQRIAPLPRDWPRSLHAVLLAGLERLGAAVVVFDMDFSRAKQAADDRVFADAVRHANRVILFQRLDAKRQLVKGADGSDQGWVWVERAVPPLPELARAARGIGPFPLPKLEATLFQFWAFKSSAGDIPTLPSLALQLLAMDHYEAWRALLEAVAPDVVAAWPGGAEGVDTAEALERVMVGARNALRGDPALAQALRDWLDSEEGARLSSERRRVLGALLDLHAGEDSRFLNFYGPPGTITTVPYHAVVQVGAGGAPGGLPDLAGKVVFVGYSDLYAPEQPDRFYTVFTREDGVDLSGVEVAATAFANLHDDSDVVPLANALAFALMLAFGLALGAMLYAMPAHFAVPLALGACVLYVFGAGRAFDDGALWLPLATPMLVQLPIALLIGLLGQYLLERGQKQRYSEAVSYYVPETVARDLAVRGIDTGAANRVIYATCLATDMAGFTALGERMTPGELASFMNEYFEALAEPLKRHGVAVTEFRADAIMCAWTAEHDDVAVRRRAVLAALDAMDAVAAFGARKQQSLACRIGLDAGHVYVGHAGGGGRFVYSIVGDSANTAARVESLNKQLATRILATGAAVEGVDELLTRPLGRFRFVGKEAPLPVLELVARAGSATPEQRRRCDRFADALQAFESGRWDVALERFEAFASGEGGDPVCALYLERCRRYLASEPVDDDPRCIVLDRK